MARSRQLRAMEQLADLQRLALEERRFELAQRCAVSDRAATDEARASADLQVAADQLDAVLAARQLCLDMMAIASLRVQGSERALSDARERFRAAKWAEEQGRVDLGSDDCRLRLVDEIARDMRRKGAEKAEAATAAEVIAIRLASARRS